MMSQAEYNDALLEYIVANYIEVYEEAVNEVKVEGDTIAPPTDESDVDGLPFP